MPNKAVEQFSDSEVIDGRAEEHRRLFRGTIALQVEPGAGAAHQFHLVQELLVSRPKEFPRFAAPDAVDGLVSPYSALLHRHVHIDLILEQMIDAEQIAPHADRPSDRRTLNSQYAFDFIEQ